MLVGNKSETGSKWNNLARTIGLTERSVLGSIVHREVPHSEDRQPEDGE